MTKPTRTRKTPFRFADVDTRDFDRMASDDRHRLQQFLLRWRNRDRPAQHADDKENDSDGDLLTISDLSKTELANIRRRSECQTRGARRGVGLEHLRSDDRKRLTSTCDFITLVAIPSEHRADEIAAALHQEFPWLEPATSELWRAMRSSVRMDEPGLRLPPMILDGPPGIGKSAFARRIAELIGTESAVVDAVSEPAGFAIAGTQRGWGTACPGRPVNVILEGRIANRSLSSTRLKRPVAKIRPMAPRTI